MKKDRLETEVKVGLFVAIGIGLTMLSIVVAGGSAMWFQSQSRYYTYFKDAMGMINGAKVILDGIHVGTIDTVDFDAERKRIKVSVLIQSRYQKWIRNSTVSEIATQGVLGDKFLSLKNNSDSDSTLLPSNSEIPSVEGGGLGEVLSSGGQVIDNLKALSASLSRITHSFETGRRNDIFFENLASAMKNLNSVSKKFDDQMTDIEIKSAISHLNSILKKIDQGEGTAGALINDPGLYDDVKALIGQANRNRVIRNLVRKTIQESDDAVDAELSTPSVPAIPKSPKRLINSKPN